jgi:hypothetical protein
MKHILLTTIAAVLLVGCGGPSVDIWNAARDGNIEGVKQHIAAGTDVNAKSERGRSTSLHYAALRGRKEIAELLIAASANVNAKDDKGWTPLRIGANINDSDEVVDLLKQHGAK